MSRGQPVRSKYTSGSERAHALGLVVAGKYRSEATSSLGKRSGNCDRQSACRVLAACTDQIIGRWFNTAQISLSKSCSRSHIGLKFVRGPFRFCGLDPFSNEKLPSDTIRHP